MDGLVGSIISPPATTMNPIGQTIAIWTMVVLIAVFLVYAIIMGRKLKSWLPVLFLVVGGLGAFMEPAVEVLGHCVEAVAGQITAFTWLGRPMPLHIALLFVIYFGAPWLIMYPKFLAGKITKSSLWKVYGVTLIIFWVPEILPMSFGMWEYYAPNALHFGHLLPFATTPLWFPFYASAMVYFGFTVICVFHDMFKGWRQLLMVPIATIAIYGAMFGFGFPVYIAINMDIPGWLQQAAGLLNIGLCLFVISMCGQYFDSKKQLAAA